MIIKNIWNTILKVIKFLFKYKSSKSNKKNTVTIKNNNMVKESIVYNGVKFDVYYINKNNIKTPEEALIELAKYGIGNMNDIED